MMGHSSLKGIADAGLSPGGRVDAWSANAVSYVALDVDGTLVQELPTPGERVLSAVRALTSQGVAVGLATGRMAASARSILATGVFTGPHVFNNGAVTTDGDGRERSVLGLTDDEVDAVLELGRQREDVWVEVYLSDEYLADRTDPRSGLHVDLLGLAPSGRIASARELNGRPAVKAVMVCLTEEAERHTLEAVRSHGLAAGSAGSPATPQLRYVNITRSGVDKGSGVAAAAGSAGIDLPEVVCIGDETNDIPALERAGTAIAMGGSAPAVTASAHFVAPDFAQDGAAVALEALRVLDRR